MPTIINTKLSEKNGVKRVWIEGVKLKREGYEPGMRFDIKTSKSSLFLNINPQGKYTISKRKRNGGYLPIIDLNNKQISDLFHDVEMLKVYVKSGSIIITAHHQHVKVNERMQRLIDKMTNNKPLSVCSLFHGGGVLDKAIHRGLTSSGIASNVGIAVEVESKYLDSSLLNNPELWSEDSIVINAPIESVNVMNNSIESDICIAGIPCTGASKSGRSKNKLKFAESHDSAGSLFFSFLQFVQAVNPSIVIIENVPEYSNTASMEVIRSVLGSLGYDIQETILDGNDFGVLERRKRLCVVALSKGLEHFFDINRITPVKTKESCLNDILEPLSLDSDRWKIYDYLDKKEMADIKKGSGFRRQTLTGGEAFCGSIGRSYNKVRSTEPQLQHPSKDGRTRLFSATEHARIKGVPVEVIKDLSTTVAHEVLGQSVDFPAFEALAKELGKALNIFVSEQNTMSTLVA